MADTGYAEGTIADGPNGQTAIFTGGKWVVQGSPQMPIPSQDQGAIGKLQTEAQDSAYLDRAAQQFMGMMGSGRNGVATGPVYTDIEIPHVSENINPARGIGNAMDNRIGALESITNQTWAHMRPTGSGALRAPEISGFQQSFPNVENWGNQNALIAHRLHANAMSDSAKLQFIDDYIRGNKGDYADANAAWQQQVANQPPDIDGRPMPAPRNSNIPDPSGPVPGTVEGGYRFRGGDPTDSANWLPVNAQPTTLGAPTQTGGN